MRRKGEKPVTPQRGPWSKDHPVADAIASGDPWFGAWAVQCCTPLAVLSKRTRIPLDRLYEIDRGEKVSTEELSALAEAWRVSPEDVLASMPEDGWGLKGSFSFSTDFRSGLRNSADARSPHRGCLPRQR